MENPRQEAATRGQTTLEKAKGALGIAALTVFSTAVSGVLGVDSNTTAVIALTSGAIAASAAKHGYRLIKESAISATNKISTALTRDGRGTSRVAPDLEPENAEEFTPLSPIPEANQNNLSSFSTPDSYRSPGSNMAEYGSPQSSISRRGPAATPATPVKQAEDETTKSH